MQFAHEMLDKLLPDVAELMMDSFANYLIQKLNKLATSSQIEQLFINVRSFPLIDFRILIDKTELHPSCSEQAWDQSALKSLQAHSASK